VRKLPDRVWRLPRREDDEAADEGIGRILALSDGVFAIAITLLIITIAVPARTTDANLPKALLGLWPRYLAYFLSFLVIARFWVIHRLAFQLIARYDNALIWLNLLLLMVVAFLPFPTAVVGEHAGSPAAAVLYAMSVLLVSTASAAYWWYASGRGRLLRPDVGRSQVRAMRARSLSGPVFFALTVPVAVFAPNVAEVLWILAFPLARIAFVWFYAEEQEQPG
jgi:TMEM175 potassium channel family protein